MEISNISTHLEPRQILNSNVGDKNDYFSNDYMSYGFQFYRVYLIWSISESISETQKATEYHRDALTEEDSNITNYRDLNLIMWKLPASFWNSDLSR